MFLAPASLVFTAVFAVPVALLFAVSFWSVKSFRLQPDFTFTAWQRFITQYWELTLYTLFVGLMAGIICTVLGHESLGMVARLVIRPRTPPSPTSP